MMKWFFFLTFCSIKMLTFSQSFLVQWANFEQEKHFKQTTLLPLIQSELLSKSLQIWRYQILESIEFDALRIIQAFPGCLNVQLEHRLIMHEKTPNDTGFAQQWHLKNLNNQGKDIGATDFWERQTESRLKNGKQAVVAIIDVGFDTTHPDLSNSWAININEIPHNLKDDDSNGLVDDYRGFNVQQKNDQLPRASHGTQIAGVIGSQGNNILGISGIGWNIPILPVAIPGQNEGEIISAFGYVYNQRKIWNETFGEKGMFIVACNVSFGFSNTVPEETPIWCALFDSLGNQGIISTLSVPNTPINVDVKRETPSTCGSPFQICVSSTDDRDSLTSFSAIGQRHVAMAAPGKGIYTTFTYEEYGYVNGNSFAAPMAAGVLALLSSLWDTTEFHYWYQRPSWMAHALRDLLLNNTDSLFTLQGKVSSQGRLSLKNLATSWNDALNFTIAGNLRTLCQGDSIQLSVINPKPGASYLWKSDGLNLYQDTGVFVSGIAKPGVKIEVSCQQNHLGKIKVQTLTRSQLNLTEDNPPQIQIVNNELVSSKSNAYQWYDSSGFLIGQTSQTFSPPAAGRYRVKCVLPSGCSLFSEWIQFFPLQILNPDQKERAFLFENGYWKYIGNEKAFIYDAQGRQILILYPQDIFNDNLYPNGIYILTDQNGSLIKTVH